MIGIDSNSFGAFSQALASDAVANGWHATANSNGAIAIGSQSQAGDPGRSVSITPPNFGHQKGNKMLNVLGVILIIAAIFVGVRGQAAATGAMGYLAANLGGLLLAIPGVGLAMFG